MNNSHQYVPNKEDEIDLRELFMVLWKQKIMIISIAVIVALLAGLFSMFILSPVYNTELKIDLNIPQKYITRYGEYELPISTNIQYTNLITSNEVIANTINDMGYDPKVVTLESLKKRITIPKGISTTDPTQNIFDITVSANNSKESLKLAQTLYNNYIKYVDVIINRRALSYYYSNFTSNIESNEVVLASTKEILKKNEELLAKTPQTIDQSQLINTNDHLVIENLINPTYSKIEEDIVLNKQLIYSTESNIKVNKEYLKEIDTEKKALVKYYQTGRVDNTESSLISIADTSISLASVPVAPEHKTSPSNTSNAAVGFICGGMLACGVALIKGYWFKKV